MKKINLVILGVVVLSFALGIALYNSVPDKIVSHWDINGNPNGMMDKFWGLFLMPIIALAIWGLFQLITLIDPLRDNIAKFRKYFDKFILVLVIFLFYLNLVVIAWNIGYRFPIGAAMAPGLSLLFYYMSVLLVNAKRNWFIGIRTPWTMESEAVWNRTHEVGSKLFKAIAVLNLLGIFLPSQIYFGIFISLVIGVAIFLVVYSYLLYCKEKFS